MISVVVTVYNVEQYIGQCLESIINQTYDSLQIVVVDDGSTDRSGEICDDYAKIDSRIEVIHQENQGVMKALYAGIQKSSQEYITFIDGDDWIHTDTYKELGKYLDKEVDLVSFGAFRWYSNDYCKQTYDRYPEGIYELQDIEQNIYPTMLWNFYTNKPFDLDASICLKVFKRKLLKEIIEQAKNLSIYYGQDVAILYPLILKIKKIRIVHKSYYYHRQRENQGLSPYYLDKEYYAKVVSLCDYLHKYMDGMSNFEEQIEKFLQHSICLKNSQNTQFSKYVFPFDIIPFASKIVLYGAGSVGKEYFYQLNKINYCDVVCWVDMKTQRYLDYTIEKVETIVNTNYEYVVIAIESRDLANMVKKNLISMGVNSDCIVWSGK